MVTRMSATFNSAAIAAMVVALTLALSDTSHSQSSVDPTLTQLDQALADGRLDDAAVAARRLHGSASQASVRSLARLANSYSKNAEMAPAAEFFGLAIDHHDQIATGLDDVGLSLPLHLAAISVFVKNKETDRLVSSLDVVSQSAHQLKENQRRAVKQIAFRAGRDALSAGNAALANKAYRVAEDLCNDDEVATAKLGQAWAAVVDGSDPLSAAKRLGEFVDQFPDHPDAAQATVVLAKCLRQAGHGQDADQIQMDLISQFPDSAAAAEIASTSRRRRP